MQELIKVTTNANGLQVVSARNLYDFLEVKAQFTNWCDRMFEYGFEEGKDYVTILLNRSDGRQGKPQTDYALTLDTAKEIAMLQRSDKGKQARQYFIECEKQVRQQIQPQPQTDLEILSSAVLLAQRVIAEKDEQINNLAPKAEWTDKVLRSDGNYTTTNIAKELGIPVRKLNTELCKKKIQYWHDGRYVLYANYENEGYTATRTAHYQDSAGVSHTSISMVWTERGRAFLHYLFNETLSYGKPAKAKKMAQLNQANISPNQALLK